MKRPRSDVVIRLFMRGECVETIAKRFSYYSDGVYGGVTERIYVEDCLRREMAKSEKRRKR